MSRLRLHTIIEVGIKIELLLDIGTRDTRHMLLQTRAINRNVLVILFRPTIKSSTCINANLLADGSVDSEADMGGEVGTATLIHLLHFKDCALFPLDLIITVDDEISSARVDHFAAPRIGLFRK